MSVVKHVLSTHPHTHLYIWCQPDRAKQRGWGTGLPGSQECNCKRGEMGWLDRVLNHDTRVLRKLLISLPLSPCSRGHQRKTLIVIQPSDNQCFLLDKKTDMLLLYIKLYYWLPFRTGVNPQALSSGCWIILDYRRMSLFTKIGQNSLRVVGNIL